MAVDRRFRVQAIEMLPRALVPEQYPAAVALLALLTGASQVVIVLGASGPARREAIQEGMAGKSLVPVIDILTHARGEVTSTYLPGILSPMGCPENLVSIALSFAPSDYPSAKYLEGILPWDTEAFQLSAGQPYPKGFSSCAIFQLANYARAGFRAPGIGEPYAPFISRAEELLVNFGRSHNALESNPDPNTFQPGDVVHIGTGLSSHWLMVTEVPKGGQVVSVDGGQPGIAVRTRTIVKQGSTWALSGGGSTRAVLHVIRAAKLGVPCAPFLPGWTGPFLSVLVGLGVGRFAYWILS